ncbi:DUF3352 domain-containing protein [Pseudanabaena galeata UHCC 0370]|uniref:DUF3352 domain-containing protein n=1 Tax=Pseudanabaena galeata UHCC 0370 TaxID=3110310 RepID=A0ABU5TJQ7_9CYAN|nr:DUF3352 domain-containing protein [Pseudanabaena galeata]MEA5478281.1 DUF3352 domain-containing protein [Pseudanabaena galeata UHCC 0370]
MRSLFATILAISASTSALPAIANSINDTVTSSKSTNFLSTIATGNIQNSASSQFAQRSLDLAKQLPIDVIGLVVVDLNPDSWNVVSKSQTVDPISALDQLLTFFSQSPQISIAKDVQPWLGKEMAIVFSANTEDKLELTFTALSPVADGQKFELFLDKLKSLDLPKPTETLYQNVKILEWQLEEESIGDKKPVLSQKKPAITLKSLLSNKQDNSPDTDAQEEDADSEEEPIVPSVPDFSLKRLAIAKLPSGVAVISTNRQAIQKIIDTSVEISELKVAPLANHPLFLRSLNNPLWNRSVIAGYGDFKELGQISELVAVDLPETSEIPGFSRAEYIQGLKYTLGQYSSFDLFTWITPKGIRSQSNSYFSEVRSPLPKDTKTRDRLLSYLPSNLYGAITSRNLNRQWQWFVEESKMLPSYKIFVEGLRMLTPLIAGSGLDLDIEKDIISWMDGEYAVVVFPSEHSPFKEIGVDLTIGALIRTSNPEAANATLAKLAKFFTGFTEMDENILQLKKRQVGTTLLTSFEFPDNRVAGKTQSIFAYGWRDRQTLMLTLGANTASAFIPIPKPALAESEMFRDAIADMPQPNFGYFYLNANAIAKQVATLGFLLFAPNSDIPPSQDKSSQPVLPTEIQKAIDRLGGAVFVYSETSDRFQSDFFLGLNP